MSEQLEPRAVGAVSDDHGPTSAVSEVHPATTPTTEASTTEVPRPGDPVARDLADVEQAMAQVRAGAPSRGAVPTLPDDAEVAGLERAHDTLRSTLDRVDRRG